jgi:hypothetical protein
MDEPFEPADPKLKAKDWDAYSQEYDRLWAVYEAAVNERHSLLTGQHAELTNKLEKEYTLRLHRQVYRPFQLTMAGSALAHGLGAYHLFKKRHTKASTQETASQRKQAPRKQASTAGNKRPRKAKAKAKPRK